MKYFLFFISSLFVLSCNNAKKEKQDVNKQDSSVAVTEPSTSNTAASIEPVQGSAADIPENIKLKGQVQEVWKWKDNAGENLLITTAVAPFEVKQKNEFGDNSQTAQLFAFHYVKSGEAPFTQLWMLSDAVNECPFDITCAYLKNSTLITDLDKDGLAETTLQYKLTCRSDVSPADMKLIMHEGADKYALRGVMWYGMPDAPFTVTEENANLETLPGYKKGSDDYVTTFGRYESEKDFAKAPPAFLTHARRQWIQFAKETNE